MNASDLSDEVNASCSACDARSNWRAVAVAAIGALVASYLPSNVWTFGATVLILGPLCALVRADRSAYRFGGVTLAIVLLVPKAEPAWQVAFYRFAEVSTGIAVALFFATIWPEGKDPQTGK